MTTTAEPPAAAAPHTAAPLPGAAPADVPAAALSRPALADGVQLLGPVSGSGYRDGAALVRRADGQMIQLGPLMHAVLDSVDGDRDAAGIAGAASERLGRQLAEPAVTRLLEKLAAQGLLAGTESAAPPRRNPLLALRFKVLVTNPRISRAIAAPFTWLFRPFVLWPMLAAFVVVCWFVLIHHGVARATAEAFNSPGLLLLVFVLTVLSAGVHEIGHAAACRYGGAEPGGMGMGLYLVWPAFYTDVTDAYRLDRRSRLRVDLAGLYFNAVVAVATMAVWLAVRVDALLLLVALQLLQMVKQLSPVIRADGYHILADATGVPDLYAHLGPTLRRLLPGHRREPSALTGRARVLVIGWVLVIVPVLLSLMIGAVLLLPRLVTSAWDSGRHIVAGMSAPGNGGALTVLADIVRLLALALPVFGTVLVMQRLIRSSIAKARRWSAGRPGRRLVALLTGVAVVAGVAWAWWPAGQYQPVRASERGTIGSLVDLLGSPRSVAAPAMVPTAFTLPPGQHLALSAVPVGGATADHPALFLISGGAGHQPVALLSNTSPWTTRSDGDTTITSGGTSTGGRIDAAAFPFALPGKPGPHGTQALAVNSTNGGVVYNIEYALVTVRHGAPVDETNTAYAIASCSHCTTVAVSVQVVLVVGQSDAIAPVNAAGALNSKCPACATTAIADQIVVTLKSKPSKALKRRLEAVLAQLGELKQLGADGNPARIAAAVGVVQQEIDQLLTASGQLAHPLDSPSPAAVSTGSPSPTPSGSAIGGGLSPSGSATPTSESPASTSTAGSNSAGTSTGNSTGSSASVGASTPAPTQSASATATP